MACSSSSSFALQFFLSNSLFRLETSFWRSLIVYFSRLISKEYEDDFFKSSSFCNTSLVCLSDRESKDFWRYSWFFNESASTWLSFEDNWDMRLSFSDSKLAILSEMGFAFDSSSATLVRRKATSFSLYSTAFDFSSRAERWALSQSFSVISNSQANLDFSSHSDKAVFNSNLKGWWKLTLEWSSFVWEGLDLSQVPKLSSLSKIQFAAYWWSSYLIFHPPQVKVLVSSLLTKQLKPKTRPHSQENDIHLSSSSLLPSQVSNCESFPLPLIRTYIDMN